MPPVPPFHGRVQAIMLIGHACPSYFTRACVQVHAIHRSLAYSDGAIPCEIDVSVEHCRCLGVPGFRYQSAGRELMAGNECKDPGKNFSREAQRDGHNGRKCAIRSRAGNGSSLDCIHVTPTSQGNTSLQLARRVKHTSQMHRTA